MPPIYVCFLENDDEIMERHWLNAMAARVAPSTNCLLYTSDAADE